MNPFHSWLIRQRRYCEHPGCLNKLSPAVQVIKRHGKDIVVCQWHSYQPQAIKENGGELK